MEWLPVVASILSLLCLWAALRSLKRKRLIDNLPTSKTTGVFIGLVEVKGTAEAERPLRSYLAQSSCVMYAWAVDEHWSRVVVEAYTDAQGRMQTRTRHESGWTTVASGAEKIPFYLRDECGVLRIVPEGAKIEAASVFSRECGPGDPFYYGKGPAGAVSDSDHRRRFSEEAIRIHAPLYVLGRARERNDVVAAEVAADSSTPLFLISMRSEKQISSGLGLGFWLWWIFGLAICVGGFAIAWNSGRARVEWTRYLLPAFGYLFASGAFWMWMVYNSLIELRNRVRQAWSQVDIQLKRRHDLIPNLVEAARGLSEHESELQSEIARMRTQIAATPPGVAGPDPQAIGRSVVAIVERYPELKSQPSFLHLQKNLADTEQRIALARGYFNEIASFLNTRLETIPDRFVAMLARMKPRELMSANGFERAPVEPQFADDSFAPG